MSIYDLERQHRQTFYYVPRAGTFDPATGDQSGRGLPVLCRGVAFSTKDARFRELTRRYRGAAEQPFNDWTFLVRSKWLSSVSHSALIVYESRVYEVMDKDEVEDGFVITARTTNKPMTIATETASVVLEVSDGLS